MQTINRIPSLNGTTPDHKPIARKSKPRKNKWQMPSAAQQRTYATLTMGVWMPVLSMLLAIAGGMMLRSQTGVLFGLGLFAMGLMGCVLAVSLTHLAWAIADITHDHMPYQWPSWCLAISFDLSLLLGDLIWVYGEGWGVRAFATTWMVCVCVLSMGLNSWAFFRSPIAAKRLAKKIGKRKKK